MGIGKLPGGVMGVAWTIICCATLSVFAVTGAVVGCTKDVFAQPPVACQCESGGVCECDPCTCGTPRQLAATRGNSRQLAAHLVVQQGRPGLDPIEQSRLRDRETIAMHERRIRELERRIVELQRIIYRNPAIPMPRYRDPLPPLPDAFPDGFPFGEAGPIGEAPPVDDGEIIEAPGQGEGDE